MAVTVAVPVLLQPVELWLAVMLAVKLTGWVITTDAVAVHPDESVTVTV